MLDLILTTCRSLTHTQRWNTSFLFFFFCFTPLSECGCHKHWWFSFVLISCTIEMQCLQRCWRHFSSRQRLTLNLVITFKTSLSDENTNFYCVGYSTKSCRLKESLAVVPTLALLFLAMYRTKWRGIYLSSPNLFRTGRRREQLCKATLKSLFSNAGWMSQRAARVQIPW